MTQSLFLDQEPVRFEFEKTATETTLPEDPNVWPSEILQELYKQVSYIADFVPKVIPAVVDGEKGYGFGHIEVTSKTGAGGNATPEQEQAAGIRHVRIPFLVKDRKLMPLDLVLTEGSKLLPLTESRLRQALFRPQAFDVTSKTPGDQSLIGQLYPPYRQNYGFGGGGGVVNIGMGKMGEADKTVGDTARQLLLHSIYRGDAGKAAKGRAALLKQKGIPEDITAHDRYIKKNSSALEQWLGDAQKKAEVDVEEAARRIRNTYKDIRTQPVETLEGLLRREKKSSAEFRDPALPYEDRRITGPNPDYAGLKGPDNKIKKTANKAARFWDLERALHGASIGVAGGAGIAIGHHMGSKGKPGRDNLSGKYRTKKSSMLSHLLPTINESDYRTLAELIDEDEVKLAFLQNTAASKALAPLADYRPVPAEKRAAAMLAVLKHDVSQIRRLGDGMYEVKVASHHCWAPQTTRMDRGQLVDLIGTKLAMDVDTNESVTLAEGGQVEADSPEEDKLRPVNDFGMYRVRTTDGRELVGYVFPNLIDSSGTSVPLALFTNGSEACLQSDIVGAKAGEGQAIPEGNPHGKGAFFRVLPNGKAEAMVPMTVKGMVKEDLVVETFDGLSMTAKPQPNIETFTVVDDTILLPMNVHWLDLDQAQPVKLQEQAGEPTQKQAMAKMLTVDIRATGANSFSLSGMPLQKLGYADTQMLGFDDASFLLSGMGVQPEYAMKKLSEAAFAGRPVPVIVSRLIKTAGARYEAADRKAQAKLASSRLPKIGFLVKEAAMIPDTTSVDAVLSLGFLNEENLYEFIKALPVLEEAQCRMAELLFASRLGLKDVPEQAVERALRATEKVVEGLKVLAFTEN